MLSSLKEKHDLAIFNNFRRNRGTIFVRYSVMLNNLWRPLDIKTQLMPKCIFTMPPVNILLDFNDPEVFVSCDSPKVACECVRMWSVTNVGILQAAVKQEGIEVMRFMVTLYSILSDDETAFVGFTNAADEERISFDYGSAVVHPYARQIRYGELMGNLEGRMHNDPLRLTQDELDDIAAYKAEQVVRAANRGL